MKHLRHDEMVNFLNFLILQAGMGQQKHLSTKALQSQSLGFTELLHLLDRKNLMFLPWR